MQTRIRGLARVGVAVVVLAVSGVADAQLVPKKEVRDMATKVVRGLSGDPDSPGGVALVVFGAMFEGIAAMLEADGARYEGEERDGKSHGRGVLVATDDKGGDAMRFEGEFRDGKPHGRGVLVAADDKGGDAMRFEGEFRDGKPHGHGALVLDMGGEEVQFEGKFRDGKPHGYFVTVGEGAADIEIAYRDGKPHGSFVMASSDGSIVGEYRDGKPHGYFNIDLGDEMRMEGQFRDGEPVEGTIAITLHESGMVLRD